jgi:hypothetical protein
MDEMSHRGRVRETDDRARDYPARLYVVRLNYDLLTGTQERKKSEPGSSGA